MPWDANGRWVPEDDSVNKQMTGLLASDSSYLQQARRRGEQTALRRGLLNSSVAAGAATGAAIERALPIASQDATQLAQKNLQYQSDQGAMDRLEVSEGGLMERLRESGAQSLTLQEREAAAALERQRLSGEQAQQLQQLSDAGAMARQLAQSQSQLTLQERDNAAVLLRQMAAQEHQLSLSDREAAAALARQLSAQETQLTLQEREAVDAMERLLAQQEGQSGLQGQSDAAALERQREALAAQERANQLQAQTSITNQQAANQVAVTQAYMNAFASIAQNKDIPAATRDAYIRLFDQLSTQTRGLVTTLAELPSTWGGTTTGGTNTPAPPPAPPAPPPPPNPALNTPTGTGPQPDANGLYNVNDLTYRNGRFFLPDGTEVPRNRLQRATYAGGGGSGGLMNNVQAV